MRCAAGCAQRPPPDEEALVGDESVAREIAAKLKPAGYPLGEMVREIASSYPFTTKRLPGKPKSNKPANQ